MNKLREIARKVVKNAMGTAGQIKIFLSSTSIDLSEIRIEVSRWLSGIFGAELVIMETFGSDATSPDVNSVRRVRGCDLFVGIYAHRYGTVDQATGKSITELELDEAKRAFSSGTLKDILLYLIDKNAPWPNEHKETTQIAQTGLQHLKEKAQQHTYTKFRSRNELLFCIIRDVYRKLREYFSTSSVQVRQSMLPSQRSIRRPVGMEFLTSADRNYLIGRESEAEELLTRLDNDPIVLLLGDSGVGKTSLIHAGLLPNAISSGWRAIYTRPFGFPCTDIVQQIQTTIFRGRPTYQGSLFPLLAEVTAALGQENVLLIIDQFEDVLSTRHDREIEQLISGLSAIRELLNPSLRVLISYRADLEGRLGEYWQKISGSPRGLPRMYLGGINEDQAWEGVMRIAQDLSVNFKLRGPEQKSIKKDLLITSRAAGFSDVYPPYIQMLIDHIWSSSKKAHQSYQFKQYQKAKGMQGIVGSYLTRQLEYAQDSEGHVRSVLVSLVRSYGVKAQRTIDEIVADTDLDKDNCEVALEKLIDLRLVRHIGTYYEITHDFIARRINSELVGSEEREFKQFRDLLASKAAAYKTTESPLTAEELLMLFKHKARMIPNELELRLLLSSWLEGSGPALCWLLNAEGAKVLEWLRAKESREGLGRDEKVSIILLRRKLGELPLTDEDYSAFRNYQLSAEMAFLILEDPLSLPRGVVIFGLHHRREEVREACIRAIALKVKHGDWSWITRLRKSSSIYWREAYEKLILQEDVPIPKENIVTDRAIDEFVLLKKIASTHIPTEARKLFKILQKMRPPVRSLLFGKALTYIREGRIKSLLRKAQQSSEKEARVLLAAIDGKITSTDFCTMLSTYEDWNSKERGRDEAPILYAKSNALAAAILRSMSNKYLPFLLKTMKNIRLTPSSRGIVFALVKCGNLNGFKLVLDRIALEKEKVDYWNHTELGHAATRQMEKVAKGIPRFLRDIERREEFWNYIQRADRLTKQKKDLLPIKCVANRPLYIRLAAYSIIGAAEKKDQEVLMRLVGHDYGLIARSAAIRLVHLLGQSAFWKLSTKVDESIKTGRSGSFADALRFAEIEFFGLARLWE